MKTYLCCIALFITNATLAQPKTTPLEGRWDLTIVRQDIEIPSWLEVRHSGHHTLVGRFVYAFGSARPIAQVFFNDGKFNFSIPPQWEQGDQNMVFDGVVSGDKLSGTMTYTDGKTYTWTGVKAPSLKRIKAPKWQSPRKLLNENDMKGWHVNGDNQWLVEKGVLKSPKPGSNLFSNEKFTDFKLHIEFRYPAEGNSGVYLRGRYEVQIADSQGMDPWDDQFSGVYGFLPPNDMVAKAPNEWQMYDITLVGRTVTVIANGVPVIVNQIIPGITGGAIDSREAESGPIMIQGDHGPIEFRNIVITPAE